MTRLILLEPDATAPGWAPFGGVRPVAELRAGVHRIRERWATATGLTDVAIAGAACPAFADVESGTLVDDTATVGPAVVCRSDAVPDGPLRLAAGERAAIGGQVVAWHLREGERLDTSAPATGARDIPGSRIAGAWQLLDELERRLGPDCDALAGERGGAAPVDCLVLGDSGRVRIAPEATVEPGVVFDVRHGAVVIAAGAEVRSGTRLEGPVWVGPGARIVGGFVRASVIGPACVARGEVAASLFLGYANKAHDGFVGHSIIGHWVNLGALTTTSNLKNTYGRVQLEHPGGRLATDRQFVGSLIADHAKTAIGTMLSTGSIVGAGANVFGATRPPRWVPPFAWGCDGDDLMTEEGFLAVAERVLPRRQVTVTDAIRRSLRDLYRRLAT